MIDIVYDVYGNALKIGDYIVTCPGGNYPVMYFGRIQSFETSPWRDDPNGWITITASVVRAKKKFHAKQWKVVEQKFESYDIGDGVKPAQYKETNFVKITTEMIPEEIINLLSDEH